MDIFMYQIEAQFKDTTKPQISVYKLVVDEKPKTFKVKDSLRLSDNVINHYSYIKSVISKELIGTVFKTSYCGGKNYTMYVFEDTDENRQNFIDTVADKVSAIADNLKAEYTNFTEYWRNVRDLDIKRW